MASFASKKVRCCWHLVLVRPKRGADMQTPTTTRVVLINMVLLVLKYACSRVRLRANANRAIKTSALTDERDVFCESEKGGECV